jgi:hypothetical protein
MASDPGELITMNSQKFITDPDAVNLSRIGELKIDGRPALNLSSDMRSASRQVFSHLAANYPDLLAVVAGKGLSVKGSNGEYRRISGQSLKLCYWKRSSFAMSRPLSA